MTFCLKIIKKKKSELRDINPEVFYCVSRNFSPQIFYCISQFWIFTLGSNLLLTILTFSLRIEFMSLNSEKKSLIFFF